jgi:hypothetical protein
MVFATDFLVQWNEYPVWSHSSRKPICRSAGFSLVGKSTIETKTGFGRTRSTAHSIQQGGCRFVVESLNYAPASEEERAGRLATLLSQLVPVFSRVAAPKDPGAPLRIVSSCQTGRSDDASLF